MQRNLETILTQDQTVLYEKLSIEPRTSRTEVQCLLQHVLQVGRAYLFAHPERILNNQEAATYQALLQRRLSGEPIAYILGEREFFGLTFKVTPSTLIPRPETELLVELALVRSDATAVGLRMLDLGTGSGAIALSFAQHRPNAEILASDASNDALAIARENAQRLGISNVHFVESNWYSGLGNEQFNLIVSNPPYIAANDPHLVQGDLRFEPIAALASGVDGLDDLRNIVTNAISHLTQKGWLLLEHGYNQAEQVRDMLEATGFEAVFSEKDLSGIERCSGGQYSPSSKISG